MSSIIEEMNPLARINSTSDDNKYKSKKIHKNQNEKLKNKCKQEMLKSNETDSDDLSDRYGNLNGNNSSEELKKVYLNFNRSVSTSSQSEKSHDVFETLSQFTFLDEDVPSIKDFSLSNISQSSANNKSPSDKKFNDDSISNLVSNDSKNVCSTDCDGFTQATHFHLEQKCETKFTKKENETEENKTKDVSEPAIEYVLYESELQMPQIMKLITNDLSEPYSIYTYRYFIHNWPKLCFLAMCGQECVGVIVCKLDYHKRVIKRGYIAMLAVAQKQRKKGIGSSLVVRAIQSMIADDCDEVVLETEITNKAALYLYEKLGFVRDKRLFRYYLNGVDALRLKLWLK